MWKACGWIVDNFGAWSYQHFIHKFTFDYSQSYTDPFFQYFRILEGVIHISTAPTTKTTDFYYIFLYKHTHPAVRKGELSTIMKLVFDKADLVKALPLRWKLFPVKLRCQFCSVSWLMHLPARSSLPPTIWNSELRPLSQVWFWNAVLLLWMQRFFWDRKKTSG